MKREQNLSQVIKKKLRSGYPEGEMKNELLEKGYSMDQIEKAIYNVPVDKMTRRIRKESAGKDKVSMWTLIGTSLVILGISLYAAPTNFQQYANFILVAGMLCLVIKYVIAETKEK